MGRVLSYSSDRLKEYLAEHVNSCLRYWEELRSSHLGKFGLKLSKRFEDIIRISIVFHDFGKVFYKGTSFRGHEVISTYMLDEYRRELTMSSWKTEGKLLYPSLFATLFHHHPMGLRRRMETINVRLDASRIEDLKEELTHLSRKALLPEELEVLGETLEGIKSKIERGMRINDVKRYVGEIKRNIFEYFIGGREEEITIKKLSYLSLVILVIADYLAAEERRGGRTAFGDVLKEVHMVYRAIPDPPMR